MTGTDPDPVVTTTLLGPALPGGVVQLMDVAVVAVTAHVFPPTVTVPAVRLLPEIVSAVPPAVGPVGGEIPETLGVLVYVKPSVSVFVPPLVVTTTLTAPALPGGVVQMIDVSESAVMSHEFPPTVTVAPPRFVPVMVMEVPPPVEPDVGLTAPMLGAATYENPSVSVAEPLPVVTTTLTDPTDPDGVLHVTDDEDETETAHVLPPTVTVAPERLAPLIVMAVPPDVGPEFGLTEFTVGATPYVNPPGSVAVPPPVVTTTVAGPTLPAGVVHAIDDAESAVTAHAEPPTVTVADDSPVPPITMDVPPAAGPDDGVTVAIVGAGR
jgi:hypothetical protein